MSQNILEKYADILREEINVKEISEFSSDTPIVKIYKPLGSQLSQKFGKDTGQIIANGKQGNVRETAEGIEVFSANGNTRQLAPTDYEITYEGLEGDNISLEGGTIVKLDLTLTPELQREGLAREISRFLNQMRKDADFPVDARVQMTYSSSDPELLTILTEFNDFFKEEALLLSITSAAPTGDIIGEFTSEGRNLKIGLTR